MRVETSKIVSIVISLLLSLSICGCFSDAIGTAYMSDEITVEVIGANENGGSEIWISSENNAFDFTDKIEYISVNGLCEYRLASDYGYAYNFIVSYGGGGNIGTVYKIKDFPLSANKLSVYKIPIGGTAKIVCGGKEQIIDTSSDVEMLESIDLRPRYEKKIIWFLVNAAFIALLTFLINKFIPCLWGNTGYKPDVNITNGRDPSVDVARCTAAFLVVLVHSFLASGYYAAALNGGVMVLLTFIRWIALDCVPLFILITGYLCHKKTDLKKTYKSFFPFYFTYVFTVIAAALIFNKQLDLYTFANQITGMSLSTYLQMYLGLLLLIPFLNRIWLNTDKEQKQVLIIVLILISATSSFVDIPVPVRWLPLYPLTYYFIGAYLKENPINIKTYKLFLIFIFIISCETIKTIFNPKSNVFSWDLFGGYDCAYNAVIVIASTVVLFSLMIRVKVKNKVLCKILSLAGKNTLKIYLFSSLIVDNLIYPYFQQKYPTQREFLKVQFLLVLIDFIITVVLSIFISFVIDFIKYIITNRRKV